MKVKHRQLFLPTGRQVLSGILVPPEVGKSGAAGYRQSRYTGKIK
jgi:hypothetical protein